MEPKTRPHTSCGITNSKKKNSLYRQNPFPSHLCLKLQFALRRNLGFQRDSNEADLPTVTDCMDADAALAVAVAGMTSSTRWFGSRTFTAGGRGHKHHLTGEMKPFHAHRHESTAENARKHRIRQIEARPGQAAA